MESKQQLLEIISKSENDRCMYLSELFKYIPDETARTISYKTIQKTIILFIQKLLVTLYI